MLEASCRMILPGPGGGSENVGHPETLHEVLATD